MTALLARRRSPIASTVLLVLALMVVGALYSLVAGINQAQAAPASASNTQIDLGRKLYLEGCSSCHGANLEGVQQPDGSVAGPSLVGVGAAAVDFQVGTGRMPFTSPGAQVAQHPVNYTDAEIAALAAYVASISPGPAIPSPEELQYTSGDVAPGGVLYRNNCGACHNFAAEGGALSNGKYAPAMTGATDQQIWEAMLTGPANMPVFPNSTLTPKDKQQILAYVNSLRAAPNPGGIDLGRLGPVTEGLLFWVVGIGALMGVAVWIGVKVR